MSRHGHRPRHHRGATLLEIMLSMAIVLIGMLALFRVLSVASLGSQASQRHTQALARAKQVIEAMRTAPPSVLDCLGINNASNWANCETLCIRWLQTQPNQTQIPSTQACVFSTLSINKQDIDGTKQQYAVLNNGADPINTSWVLNSSLGHSVYDAQVTIAWQDNGTASGILPCQTSQHCVTLRASFYRDPQ